MPTSTAPFSVTLRRLVLVRNGDGLSDGRLLGEFVRTADPAAFEGLVRRHGAMVLGVCRRVVRDRHAAEDAFQAVWLVLARRAAAVRPREHVGNWLFGVAYRTALKARGTLARRYAREKQVTTMRHPEAPATAAAWADVAPVIDAELARLPDDLRLPVVLCDLEGRPQRDAARHLGLPVTTLVNRLMKARRALAKRLTDRGVALSGGALAGVLGTHASAQAVPHALAAAAVAGATAGTAPAAATHLSEGVLRMMALAKLKPALVAVLAAVGLSLGVGTAVLPTASGQDSAAKQPLAPAKGLDDDAFLRRACATIRGTPATELERALFRLDPDPKKRAKVVEWLLDPDGKTAAVVVDGHERQVLAEWILGADGSVRKAEQGHGQQGLAWLRAHYGAANACTSCHFTGMSNPAHGKLNVNELPAAALGIRTRDFPGWQRTKAADPTDSSDKWVIQFPQAAQPPQPNPDEKPAEKKPTDGKKPPASEARRLELFERMYRDAADKIDDPNRNATRSRLERFYAQRTDANDPANAQTVRRLQAEVDQAKAELELQRKNLERLEKGRAEADEAKANLATAQARLDKATAELTAAGQKDKPKPPGVVTEVELGVVIDDVAHMHRAAADLSVEFLNADKTDDATFLRRVLLDTLGVIPTALEMKYFTEDKDPKKREKVIDLILKDPKVAAKVGPDWRNKVLGLPVPMRVEVFWADDLITVVPTADPFAKLLDQVLDGKRSDEQIADAICLATVGRFPTESEQKMALAAVAGAKDKRAVWAKVATTLAGTKEAQAHAEALKKK